MTLHRHKGLPTKEEAAALKPLDDAGINALMRAAIQARLTGKDQILLVINYRTKFAEDFPRGIFVRREGLTDIRRIKVKRILDWLRNNGYLEVTEEQIRVANIAYTKKTKELFNDDL